MRAGAAEIKSTDRRFVARPIENGAHGEELIERELAMENLSAGETVNGFQIVRSDDLHVFDEAGKIGRVFGKCFDDDVAEVFAADAPVCFVFIWTCQAVDFVRGNSAIDFIGSWSSGGTSQLKRSELHISRKHVLAFGRERRIEKRGNGDVEIGCGGKFAVLRGVKRMLKIIDFWANVNAASERLDETVRRDSVGKRRESGKTAKSEMNFGDSSRGANIANAQSEGRIELSGIEKLEKCALGIDAGNDGIDGDFFPISKDEANNGSVFHANMLHLGIGPNFRAGFASGFGKSARERAETSARECRGPGGIRIDGGAQKKDCRGAGGPRTERSPKTPSSCDDCAEQFGFEKLADEIRYRHGAPAEQIENTAFAQTANVAARLEKIPKIFGRGRVNRGRRDGTELREEAGDFFKRRGELRIFCGVFCGEMRD